MKFAIPKSYLVAKYVKRRKSAFDIAKELGCSPRTIYVRMNEFNIPRRTHSEATITFYNINLPTDNKIKYQYCVLKKSASEIGREIGCSKTPILKKLKSLGVPIHLSAAVGRYKGIPCPQKAREQANIPKLQLIHEYTSLKMTCTQLAQKYNCSHFAICERLRKYKIQLRYQAIKIKKERLYYLYHVNKLSCGQIATKYKCSPESIRGLLKKYGIPRRTKSEASQIKWQDTKYRICTSRRLHKSIRVPQNKMEIKVFNKLNKLAPNQWAFVGDGKFFIESLNPDFININGRKQIIEVFGDYWHRNDNPKKRIELFKKYGYETLILWEKEIRQSKKYIEKIIEFIG